MEGYEVKFSYLGLFLSPIEENALAISRRKNFLAASKRSKLCGRKHKEGG